jgi:hypothetical protein
MLVKRGACDSFLHALFSEAERLFCCSKCKLIYDEGQTFEFHLMEITLTVFLKSNFGLLLESARVKASLLSRRCVQINGQ